MSEPVVIGNAMLYLGDCREIVPLLPRVDSIITDPPYSAKTHAGHDQIHRDGAADASTRSALGYGALTEENVAALAALYASKCDGWIVWMTDHVLAPSIRDALEGGGRYVFAPLPFFQAGRSVRITGDGPCSWTDWIVVSRTTAQVKWGTLPGGYVAGPGWKDKARMGGKPTELMKSIVRDYSRLGDVVLDPFMGAGTTGVASLLMGRKFIGIEVDADAFEIARSRIEETHKQAALFSFDAPPAQEQGAMFSESAA